MQVEQTDLIDRLTLLPDDLREFQVWVLQDGQSLLLKLIDDILDRPDEQESFPSIDGPF